MPRNENKLKKLTFNCKHIQCENPPSNRSFHCCTILNSKLYIYGGMDARQNVLSSLCTLNLDNFSLNSENEKRYSWNLFQTNLSRSHSCCCVYNGSLIMNGGWNAHKRCSDTYILDENQMKFNEILGHNNNSSSLKVAGHSSHTINVINDTIVTCGRQSGQRRFNDLHSYSFTENFSPNWNHESSSVKSRSGHSASLFVYNNQKSSPKMIIFGGRSSNDLDLIDTKTLTCSRYSFPTSNSLPTGRSYHSSSVISVPYHGKMMRGILIIGGLLDPTTLAKKSYFLKIEDAKSNFSPEWFDVEFTDPVLPNLYGMSSVVYNDPETNKELILIFGGKKESNLCSNQLFVIYQ